MNSGLTDGQQQDSNEFLIFLLNALIEETEVVCFIFRIFLIKKVLFRTTKIEDLNKIIMLEICKGMRTIIYYVIGFILVPLLGIFLM